MIVAGIRGKVGGCFLGSMAAKVLVRAAWLLLIAGFLAISMAHTKETIIDDDAPIKVNGFQNSDEEGLLDEGPTPCHVDYQVVKRVEGSCVKLGRTMRGCVAGNYLHAGHPDCM